MKVAFVTEVYMTDLLDQNQVHLMTHLGIDLVIVRQIVTGIAGLNSNRQIVTGVAGMNPIRQIRIEIEA